jgi:hypothetical protein
MHSTVSKCLELDPAEKKLLAMLDHRLRDAVVRLMQDAHAAGLDADKLNDFSTTVLMTVAADVALRACAGECDEDAFSVASIDAFRWAVQKRIAWTSAGEGI